jgi:hypothetical protein
MLIFYNNILIILLRILFFLLSLTINIKFLSQDNSRSIIGWRGGARARVPGALLSKTSLTRIRVTYILLKVFINIMNTLIRI